MPTTPQPKAAERRPAQPPQEYVEVADGIHLAAWTTLNPDVESLPLVIVHGGPGLWSDHDDLIALLTHVATVHSYDQRGCGRSRPGPTSDDLAQSMDATVADLEALRRHWGHDRWVVLGHSFGADVALAYAATHPAHTAAAGFLSGRGIDYDRSHFAAIRAQRWGPDRQAEHARLSELTERSWDEEVRWRQLQVAFDYADFDRGMDHSRKWATTDLVINYTANRALSATDEQKVAWAASTACPVFFIHGGLDPRPVSSVVSLASHAPQARKRLIQSSGHFPWVEEPDETVAVIQELVLSAS